MPGMTAISLAGLSAIFGRSGGLSVASIYGTILVQDGTTAQATIGTTPAKMTGFAIDGPSQGMTPDHTDDSLTLDVAGDYLILCNISFSGSANSEYHIHLRVNDVEQQHGFHRKLGAGGDVGCASFSGVLSLSANDVLTVWVESDNGLDTDTYTPTDAQFLAVKIG